MASAVNHPSGWIGLSTDFQFFTAGDFLVNGEDHSRMINTYSIVWAPLKYFEAAVAMHVTSDRSLRGDTEDLMVAVGDPELSLKGGYEIIPGLALGALFDLRFPSGSGFFESAISSTSFLMAILGSYTISPSVPLSIHLNVGFYYDGTDGLFDDLSKLNTAQLYAAQVSSFHRVIARFGLEYATTYVGPFVELSLEPYVGDGAPGFSRSPGLVSFGARIWPTKSKGLQLLAGLDVGVTGVGKDDSTVLPTGKYAYSIPRWNLVLGLSYRFDAYGKTETSSAGGGTETDPPKGVTKDTPTGAIHGVVLDGKTEKPVWNARVSVEGEEVSPVAVNASDGTFKTYKLKQGKQIVVASADGYTAVKTEVEVKDGAPVSTTIKLMPKASSVPGTIRGKIKALVGKNPRKTTILIPALDKTIKVGKDGNFSITLKPGEYKIVINARRFRTQRKTIRVREGATVILNVELHK